MTLRMRVPFEGHTQHHDFSKADSLVQVHICHCASDEPLTTASDRPPCTKGHCKTHKSHEDKQQRDNGKTNLASAIPLESRRARASLLLTL